MVALKTFIVAYTFIRSVEKIFDVTFEGFCVGEGEKCLDLSQALSPGLTLVTDFCFAIR